MQRNHARSLRQSGVDAVFGHYGVLLVRAGFDVEEAVDGKAGLVCYRQQRCDVVITDILMPQQDGLETIRELRRIDPLVPIIAMSGADHNRVDSYFDSALQFGARKVLYKPFRPDELLTAITEILTTG